MGLLTLGIRHRFDPSLLGWLTLQGLSPVECLTLETRHLLGPSPLGWFAMGHSTYRIFNPGGLPLWAPIAQGVVKPALQSALGPITFWVVNLHPPPLQLLSCTSLRVVPITLVAHHPQSGARANILGDIHPLEQSTLGDITLSMLTLGSHHSLGSLPLVWVNLGPTPLQWLTLGAHHLLLRSNLGLWCPLR